MIFIESFDPPKIVRQSIWDRLHPTRQQHLSQPQGSRRRERHLTDRAVERVRVIGAPGPSQDTAAWGSVVILRRMGYSGAVANATRITHVWPNQFTRAMLLVSKQ